MHVGLYTSGRFRNPKHPASGHRDTSTVYMPSGTDAGCVLPTPLITRLRPQEGSESGQLSARGFEPTHTPTTALQAYILTRDIFIKFPRGGGGFEILDLF